MRPTAMSTLLLLAFPAFGVAAQDPPTRRMPLVLSARAQTVATESVTAGTELVTLARGLAAGLTAVALEEEVRVIGWPVSPGQRDDLRVTRHDVYAPEAKIWAVEGTGIREVPRSRHLFLWGVAERTAARVLLIVDPDSGDLSGITMTAQGDFEVTPVGPPGARRHRVRSGKLAPGAAASEAQPAWSCGQSDLPEPFVLDARHAGEGAARPRSAAAIVSVHTARIAVDTDNELMFDKFANNTTTATDFIAALIAGMSTAYERDLLVRLLQGQTFLRSSTTPDPYHVPCGAAVTNCTNPSSAGLDVLDEFGDYWLANYTTYFDNEPRHALAMMLSGKSLSGGSGIAWRGTLCNRGQVINIGQPVTAGGFSFTQLFNSGSVVHANEIRLVAHELGHNFGSPHTHCYANPPDHCYAAEAGCYAEVTSCPTPQTINGVANVRGTVMSYCHGLPGCSSSTVFHPASVALLQPEIESHVNACIFPAVPPPAAPTVNRVYDWSGPTTGNALVTITGTGFEHADPDNDVEVAFGGTPATAVNVIDSTTLQAITPARPTGTVAVTVRNPDLQQGSLANGYFYVPPPADAHFYTVSPCRAIDTLNAAGNLGGPALAANGVRAFALNGTCGITINAKAIAVNVTVATPASTGEFEAFPGNAFPFGTTVLAFTAGQNRAAQSVLMMSTDNGATLGFRNNSAGAAHLIVDVVGYWQ
jgi:hypothetical protein